MADDIQPLTGAIATLNWFDAQRKHYETPDQVARRFKLPDDSAARAFCQGAATLRSPNTVRFVRHVPGTTESVWSGLFEEAETAAAWLYGVEWELRTDGEFRFASAATGIASEGRIARLEAGAAVELAPLAGGATCFEIEDASDAARARRAVPNYAGPIAELRLTDRVADGAAVAGGPGDTSAEHIAQPGGAGTHAVGAIAAWHRTATLFQQRGFGFAGAYWPPELGVGLDMEALVAAYAKLLPAYHRA